MRRQSCKAILATIAFLCAPNVTLHGDAPRAMSHYVAKHGGGMNMNVPRRPLTPEDVARWSEILNASEPQQRFFQTMYERFVERHNEFMDREAPEFLRLTRDLDAAARQSMSDRNTLRQRRVVDNASRRIIGQLTAIEHEFVANLEPVLAEDQIEWLFVLRNDATRRNCRVYPSLARWGQIELREIWRELLGELAPAERELIERIVADYEAALTPLICESADAMFRARQRLAEHRLSASERPITAEQARARVNRIVNELGVQAERIRALHEQTLARIEHAFDSETAQVFVRSAKEAAFRELYPDPYAAHALFEAALRLEILNEEDRRDIGSLLARYTQEYVAKCRALEEFCIEFGQRTARRDQGYSPHLLPSHLEPRLLKRDELTDEFVGQLAEIIGAETLSQLDEPRVARADRPELRGVMHDIETVRRLDQARAREAGDDGPDEE